MKVITIATEINQHLERLLQSATHFNISLEILGKDRIYRDHNDKTIILLEYLNSIQSSETVLYLDGYDCIFLKDLTYITETFKKFNHPFVISTEQNFNCDSPFPQKLSLYLKYPKGSRPYRFLNAGGWIANAGYAIEILQKILAKEGNDQSLMNRYMAENHNALCLDYNQEIFTCTAGRTGLEMKDYRLKYGRIQNTITGAFPAIFHAAGKNFIGLSKIIAQLPYLKNEVIEDKSIINNYDYSKFMNKINAWVFPDNFLFHSTLKVAIMITLIILGILILL